jgi:uncharacterized membrane protein
MTTITGYSFNSADGVQKMVDLVQDLSRQQLITLEDAAIVTWPEGKKKPKTDSEAKEEKGDHRHVT